MENDNKEFNTRSFVFGLIAGLFVMLFLSIGGLILYNALVVKKLKAAIDTQINDIAAQSDKSREGIFNEDLMNKLGDIEKYFNKYSIYDMDDEEIRRGVIEGYLYGTGDKYAEYYDPDEIDELNSDLQGKFYGIGATLISGDDGWPTITSVYDDAPAGKAGLKGGDRIVEIDGENSYKKSLDEVVSKIRGPIGTNVTLKIAREGEDDYLEFTITRAEVIKKTVDYRMENDRIGYIQITSFEDATVDQFTDALATLKGSDMKALVIDLRSNTGGLLSAVVDIADQLLPKSLILYTENVAGVKETFESDEEHKLQIPIVVLTNGYTASAAEILTGTLRDNNAAISMGTTTYGKGVVQGFKYFKDGSAMKLTIEEYFLPSGFALDGVGIEPDIEVKFDSEAYYDEENPFDNQFDEAVKYLENKLN
ncbi:MAG: S41 family peptidase [Lachnospiraceae bacterium]|nr:S41 family peptidase [Lachnospiraceae bacterium]